MTNTRITDAEVFERRYPVILREFSLREGSAGKGFHTGGEGVVRDIEFRIPVQVSILSERRVFHPYGLEGGEDAACGVNLWVRRVKGSSNKTGGGERFVNGEENGRVKEKVEDGEGEYTERIVNLGAKNTASMAPGERIIVMTPGGGGWGLAEAEGEAEGKDAAEGTRGKKKATRQRERDPQHNWRKGSVAARMEAQETA